MDHKDGEFMTVIMARTRGCIVVGVFITFGAAFLKFICMLWKTLRVSIEFQRGRQTEDHGLIIISYPTLCLGAPREFLVEHFFLPQIAHLFPN